MWQTEILVNHFTRLFSSEYILSRMDKKGRIFIPIRLRAKLRFLEGMRIRLAIKDGKLFLERDDENG